MHLHFFSCTVYGNGAASKISNRPNWENKDAISLIKNNFHSVEKPAKAKQINVSQYHPRR